MTTPRDIPKGVRPSLADPWILVAAGFGTGYLPKAPGTWASAAAALLAWPMAAAGGWPLLVAAAALATVAGLPAIVAYHRQSGTVDPRQIVVDEFAGQWLTLAACPLDPAWWLAGFLGFRLFDVLKPPPVRWADRRFKTAFGVMLDDLLAALYAVAAILLARWFLLPAA